MRAIIEIFLAIIFSTMIGRFSLDIKKEAILKVHNGLGSLESFTKELSKR